MADFRKFVPVLAVLALILGLTATGSAQVTQSMVCNASAVPTNLRAEGITELVGDIVLDCTGGTPAALGAPVQQVNIQVFMNATVTSRILSADPSGTSGISEALLLIDEPKPGLNAAGQSIQTFCSASATGGQCAELGTGSGVPYATGGTYTVPGVPTPVTAFNAFLGSVRGGNSVVFLGVPIDPPGSNTAVHRVIRITNIRVNASAFTGGVTTGGGPVGQPGQVTAFVTIAGPTPITVNNPTQVVGAVQTGLLFDARNFANSDALTVPGFMQCAGQSQVGFMSLRFRENFASAFKPRFRTDPTTGTFQNNPGSLYFSESGFFAPFQGIGGIAGIADFATRVKAVFNNIPAGVQLWVSRTAVNASASINAVATVSETGAFSPIPTTVLIGGEQAIPVPLTSATTGTGTTATTTQSGQVVWEVTAEDPLSIQTLVFHVWLSYTANPGANSPSLTGTQPATVNGMFAPISTVTTASASAPIPRFADKSSAVNIFNVVICATNILFPFVTNQGGFDTGLAIANTTQDIFGTTAQSGTCTLNAFGTNAPAAITSAAIAGGTVQTFLASAAMPNFQGYVIARCLFSFGHGFAFISDLGARNLAMGYLALIIPDQARVAAPNGGNFGGGGEQLTQ